MEMKTTRVNIKRAARELVRSSRPSILLIALVYFAVYLLFMFLCFLLKYDANALVNSLLSGDIDAYMYFAQGRSGSAAVDVALVAIDIVSVVWSAGFIIAALNTVRGSGACLGNLLDGFIIIGRILLLYLLEYLFILLWSLLLIVPGIIATYRYSMAIYLLIDNPDMSPMECIRESKRMMAGHKWELFVLQLSFIGWGMLCCIPILGLVLMVWLVAYMELSYILFYEKLSGRFPAPARQQEPPMFPE